MTRITGNDQSDISSRRFPAGIRFKTICAECNNNLGGREDKALLDLYDRVRKIVRSPIVLAPLIRIPAKPNLIIRSLLAHLTSANDNGIPSLFDDEARSIILNKKPLSLSSWNLFYWLYFGQELFVARSLFHTTWYPNLDIAEMFIMKFYPLAFLFTKKPIFYGLPNMMKFVQARDEKEAELPLFLNLYENHPVWPAYTGKANIIMLGGNAFGLVATPD